MTNEHAAKEEEGEDGRLDSQVGGLFRMGIVTATEIIEAIFMSSCCFVGGRLYFVVRGKFLQDVAVYVTAETPEDDGVVQDGMGRCKMRRRRAVSGDRSLDSSVGGCLRGHGVMGSLRSDSELRGVVIIYADVWYSPRIP